MTARARGVHVPVVVGELVVLIASGARGWVPVMTPWALVAGPVAESAGWRWIYLLPIPIALIALAVAATMLPESRAPHARRLDWSGQISAAIAGQISVHDALEQAQKYAQDVGKSYQREQ